MHAHISYIPTCYPMYPDITILSTQTLPLITYIVSLHLDRYLLKYLYSAKVCLERLFWTCTHSKHVQTHTHTHTNWLDLIYLPHTLVHCPMYPDITHISLTMSAQTGNPYIHTLTLSTQISLAPATQTLGNPYTHTLTPSTQISLAPATQTLLTPCTHTLTPSTQISLAAATQTLENPYTHTSFTLSTQTSLTPDSYTITPICPDTT